VALKALAEAGHAIAAVYSQPPRPAGRGQEVRKSPVQALAEARGFPVRTPASLKSPEVQAELAGFGADVGVVAAYGLILPQAILGIPPRGCLNIHASLLPRWRGAAPIQRAILAGDAETGISIMQMDAGLDTGPVILEKRIAIAPHESAGQLHDRLAVLGGEAIVEALGGSRTPHPQPEEGVTYAAKISPQEAHLDFTRPAAELSRAIRAFNPVPGAWALLPNGERLKILEADVVAHDGEPGVLFHDGLVIGTGEAALRPTLVQRQGKKAMQTADFLRGGPVKIGDRLT
jgi:methionyl-tRNA formyltransferase